MQGIPVSGDTGELLHLFGTEGELAPGALSDDRLHIPFGHSQPKVPAVSSP